MDRRTRIKHLDTWDLTRPVSVTASDGDSTGSNPSSRSSLLAQPQQHDGHGMDDSTGRTQRRGGTETRSNCTSSVPWSIFFLGLLRSTVINKSVYLARLGPRPMEGFPFNFLYYLYLIHPCRAHVLHV